MKKISDSIILQFKSKKIISVLVFLGLLSLTLLATTKLRQSSVTKLLQSLVTKLPQSSVTKRNLFESDRPFLTIHCNGGRLGNQMCTLASLYGLSNLNKRKMVIPPCNYEKLRNYFDLNITVLDINNFNETNPWSIKPYLEEKDKWIDDHSNIIKGYTYPCSFTFFNHVRHQIKTLFRFKPEIQEYAHNVLLKARGDRTNVTFVGVHVRRTDYLGTEPGHWLHAFEGKSVDLEYFKKATEYYKKKYKNILFLAVSDDRLWCLQNLVPLGITVTEDVPSPAHDMAILANCNHTIMTYGTFGFWGSYLAGGEVVYFDKYLKPNTIFTTTEFLFDKMYLPEWVGIETESWNPE